jgi:hypothetical protein
MQVSYRSCYNEWTGRSAPGTLSGRPNIASAGTHTEDGRESFLARRVATSEDDADEEEGGGGRDHRRGRGHDQEEEEEEEEEDVVVFSSPNKSGGRAHQLHSSLSSADDHNNNAKGSSASSIPSISEIRARKANDSRTPTSTEVVDVTEKDDGFEEADLA